MVVGPSVPETEIVALAEQPVIVCETFLVGKDISIQTFPTWHPKPVSGCRQECVLEDRGDGGLQSWWRLRRERRSLSSGLQSWCWQRQGRGFESDRGGSGRCDRTRRDRYPARLY